MSKAVYVKKRLDAATINPFNMKKLKTQELIQHMGSLQFHNLIHDAKNLDEFLETMSSIKLGDLWDMSLRHFMVKMVREGWTRSVIHTIIADDKYKSNPVTPKWYMSMHDRTALMCFQQILQHTKNTLHMALTGTASFRIQGIILTLIIFFAEDNAMYRAGNDPARERATMFGGIVIHNEKIVVDRIIEHINTNFRINT